MAVTFLVTVNLVNYVSETENLRRKPERQPADTVTSDVSVQSESSVVVARGTYTVCDICCRRFASSRSLTRHLKCAHKTEAIHMSGNDIQPLNSEAPCNDVESSIESEGEPPSAQFICTHCGRQFRLRQLLAAHSVTHTGARPAACRFPGCGRKFGQTSTRNYHERTHSDVRPYVCSQCGQSFKQPTIFKTHVATVHGNGARPHQCSQCGKAFKLYGALRTHYKSVHMDVRPHPCSECSKQFKYKSQLARHKQALHSYEHPWRCCVCDKTFTQPGNLRTHMRTHTGEKPYCCSVCGQNFAHSGTLKGHMATHRPANKQTSTPPLSHTNSSAPTALFAVNAPFQQTLPL